MPLNKPILDTRSFQQIRDELVARIPVYAPEWTDHNASDPGITLLELYSFLAENLLYRFNQIPEATFLEFLKLLQIPLLPAEPARSLVAFSTEDMQGVRVAKGSVVKAGEVGFSSQNEVRVLPVSAFAVAKIAEQLPEPGSEEEQFFEQAYRTLALDNASDTAPYVSRLLWQQEPGTAVNFDEAVDGILWLPVLAADAGSVAAVRAALAGHKDAPLLLNLGVVPDVRIDRDEDVHSPEFAERFRCPGNNSSASGPAVEWQIWSDLSADFIPRYRSLSVEGDTSAGLTREGVVRLRLPRDLDQLGLFAIDDPDAVGAGDLPPPLDDELNERVVFWLRAFRHDGSRFGQLLYVGANCVQVEQTVLAKGEFLGTGTAQPNQVLALVNAQVVAGSAVLQVEEADGWQTWQEVDGFFASGEEDRHYSLDAAAGTVKFGNGLQGLVPQIGQRIRVTEYRYGGGVAGNVAAKAIAKLQPSQPVKLANPLPAYGGAEAETVEQALERIPGELRRRDRAVTEGDFKELARLTPGANISRAECLPRYHPQRPEAESAGVVSVVAFPMQDAQHPAAPMPDKNQLRRVCQYLDARRLVTTELYVLPPKYRPVAVAVGVKVKPGYGIDAVRHWVELVIRQFLAPLPPFGPSGEGWPLGRRVHAPELEAAAHQVEGVEYIEGLQIAGWDDNNDLILLADGSVNRTTITLAKNEVPELTSISVENGPITLDPAAPGPLSPEQPDKPPVPIPVIKEVC
ncbi:putative baseplate assembly protein [Pseudomaricurvus alcaniphilus]|uniref:putative baseplate assembly protein n=1 Tax=Pseudomaricurvus alcaniphilus TaxID=1166482 RepID=UPI00140D28FF|nr:putative baseplate assembly protein [Pseudomaricurvus alcaniphilus]NHN38331.1 putative baseplate assembly protein [Pseudomaricurvus alcaniphilus]